VDRHRRQAARKPYCHPKTSAPAGVSSSPLLKSRFTPSKGHGSSKIAKMWRHIPPSWSNVVGKNFRLHAGMLFVDRRNSSALNNEALMMLAVYLLQDNALRVPGSFISEGFA
jgi:hypothetical protein